MTHEDYMKIAIKTAKESEQEGGAAIGAVLIKGGEIVAKGKSLVFQEKDPSGHAEMNCIRSACKTLDTVDLDDCILYGTLEPCGMCHSCSAWANIPEIYFGAYREDVTDNKYEMTDQNAENNGDYVNLASQKKQKVQGGILREECIELLRDYKDWIKQ